MGLGMVGHQHDRDLVVRPVARADASLLAHRAEAALGRGDQAGGDAPAALQEEAGARGPALGLDHLVRRHELDLGAGGEPAQQRRTEEAVLDDPAHRCRRLGILGGLAMIEMKKERTRAAVVACVGNTDVADRLGLCRHLVPDSQRLEQALAGVGDGGGAAVEARLGQGGQWHAVDQRGRKARFAGSEGQKAAVETRADDRKIERGRAGGDGIEGTAIHGP